MRGYDETLRAVLEAAEPVDAERVALSQAAGRVLAESIRADRDLPPFDRSERDGWAVRTADLPGGEGSLSWSGKVLYAGGEEDAALDPGTCLRIMTGASLPRGADAVVMHEKSRARETRVELREPDLRAGLHVHRKSVDARKGDLLLSRGMPLTASRVALAAAVGASEVPVARRLRVEVLTTGDEVVAAGAIPGRTGIRDGNGPAAHAILSSLSWVDPGEPRIVSDDETALASAFTAAWEHADAVVLSGGVSAGDKDLVPAVLERCGTRKILHQVAIRPGKPLWFGVAGERTLVFGLPGNPVSFQVTFHEFVLPGLRRRAGFASPAPIDLRFPLAHGIEKTAAFRQFVPASLGSENGATLALPLPSHGSGDVVTAARADGVIVLPEGPCRFRAGDPVLFHHWGLS